MATRSLTRTLSSAIVTHRGAILLLRRAKPYTEVSLGEGTWELPGGAIDFGESPETAIRRELHEELGLLLPPRKRLRVVDTCAYVLEAKAVRSHRVHLIFAVPLRFAPSIRLGAEHDDFAWVTSPRGLNARIPIPEIRRIAQHRLTNRTAAQHRR